jgi:hypothetical protein
MELSTIGAQPSLPNCYYVRQPGVWLQPGSKILITRIKLSRVLAAYSTSLSWYLIRAIA